MCTRWFRLRTAALIALAPLAACNGGNDPSNTPPVPLISTPAEGATFKAGDTLTFTGSATDTEDGALPAGALAWWADLHHDTHTHPFVQPASGASSSGPRPVGLLVANDGAVLVLTQQSGIVRFAAQRARGIAQSSCRYTNA